MEERIFFIFCVYFVVKLANSARSLFGFSVVDKDGERQYYNYNSLPFGISTAVHLTERLTRPIKAMCLRHNVSLSIYIDDGIVVSQTKESCRIAYNFSVFLLLCAGWKLQKAKCTSEPQTKITYLGYILDSSMLMISVPVLKCDKVCFMIDKIKEHYDRQIRIKNKEIARYTGLMAHCYMSHGNFVSVVSRIVVLSLAWIKWEGNSIKLREKIIFYFTYL